MSPVLVIFIKFVGIAWMLGWFFVFFRIFVKGVNGGLDPFAGLLAIALTWFLVGLCPVLIAKLGWWLISGRPVQ